MVTKSATKPIEEIIEREELVIEIADSDISEEVREKAYILARNYKRSLEERTLARLEKVEAGIEVSDPLLPGGYQYWNCLTAGPIQFTTNPPYRAHKIVAAGEPVLMMGVIWINPLNGPGGSLSGTTVLGARECRACFETVNLSTVTQGPKNIDVLTFSSPAPIVSIVSWMHTYADPGVNPHLMEVNFTADVTTIAQPFAAVSSWHYDMDSEPAFMGMPSAGGGFQFERPTRFLVYRK